MAVRKTLLKSTAGVKLMRIDEVANVPGIGERVRATHFRLSTLRPAQPRILANEALADTAFEAEVAASMRDPTALRLAGAGHREGPLSGPMPRIAFDPKQTIRTSAFRHPTHACFRARGSNDPLTDEIRRTEHLDKPRG